jgi:hypothetical protein
LRQHGSFRLRQRAIRSSGGGDVQLWLMHGPSGKALLVEGHYVNGTDEYNRAWGVALCRCAALIALGADGCKITTRSHGRDRKIAAETMKRLMLRM